MSTLRVSPGHVSGQQFHHGGAFPVVFKCEEPTDLAAATGWVAAHRDRLLDDAPKSGMGRSWQSTLRAKTREEAEARLRELGYSWEWLPDGCLRATTPTLPAVRKLPDGRTTFFNQLIAAYHGWKDTRNDPSKAIT